jgi:hypothetical protein
MLEAVSKERLVKTKQAGKGSAGAVVVCEVRRLAIALYFLVVPNGVYKWSVNRFTNPNPHI